ncbi:UDP-N-acetylenolpyruvoylglucosamine reductase [Bacteroidia bacterium]|nr:UDP-N-acetylenolpyruvoylglucosamine reductase [Bacteroidia bacterium]GHV20959.1 UDP-N-acetylenolpyruvoylglucosamine reductase [Bacteroidia bacterium]
MKIYENYSLKEHNTFHLDVKTRWFLEYESEKDLQTLLSDEFFFSQTFWHIGQGSNLLFLGDFNGIIVHSAIKGIEVEKETGDTVWVKSGAGVVWDDFVLYCVENGWSGVENLSLIPGEVGASAVQNIGAYGAEVGDCIVEVHVYSLETGEKIVFSNADCEFAYRKSFFKTEPNKGKYFVSHVVFRLSKKDIFNIEYGNLKEMLKGKDINLKSIREAVITIRENKLPDPRLIGNAGSFFMNPYVCMEHFKAIQKKFPNVPFYPVNDEVVKVPAAWFIDQCGLKGRTFGGAAVHEKQPLVIVNKDGATGNDIARLAEEVRSAVKKKFTIELQPEVNYI